VRKALEAEFLVQLKILSKELGWGFLKPTPFKRVGDWFVDVNPSIYRDEVKAHISLNIKPFDIDDMLSRMTFGEGMDQQPLSLRARGPLCLTTPCLEMKLPAEGPVEEMVRISRLFLEESEKIAQGYDLDAFISFVGEIDERRGVNMNAVAARVLQGDFVRARQLVNAGLQRGDKGNLGRMTTDGKFLWFFDLADKWLAQRDI
jgi:hypothetical protein